MKKYDAYMPSGIDWIGEIPEEWELKRGRYIVKLLSGFPADSNLFTDDDSFMPLIRIRDIDNTTTEVFYKGDYPKEYLIQYNDVLVGMDGDFNIAKWKGSNAILNQRVCKIIETDEMLADYAYYLFQTPLKLINDVTYSTTVKHMSTNDIKDFRFPVPPLSEQIAITKYLDTWCTKIDNVIAIQQKRIELLKELKQSIITKAVTKGLDKTAKMKDSGIEWIGEIPEMWRLKRGRFIVKLLPGFPADSNLFTDDDTFMPLIRIRDIENTTTEVFYKGDYPKEYLIQANDVLVGMDGEFNIAKWKGSDAILNQRVCKIIETDEMLENYAYYLFQTPLKLINDVTYSTTVKHLSTNDIKDFRFSVPPLSEQTAIADYLDKKCATIDKQILKVEKQIELLKEYKQSVITECVTGKRKVC